MAAMQRAMPAEKKAKKEKNKGFRELTGVSLRSIEGEGNERKFELSFSSEEPYLRWFGQEILDHHTEGAVDLSRLNSIGCVLFNHDRNKVIGRINRAWVEDKRGHAEIEFDEDEASEVIYQKVKSGTLKGVSVGYIVENWEEVMANKQSEDGFVGPCSIARKWAPYEVSIVSVPADPTVGVGRSEEDPGAEGDGDVKERDASMDMYERQLQINKNYMEVMKS